jgi:hypothetical protein
VCGKEGHCIGECKKPRDNKHIDDNKMAFIKHRCKDTKARKKGTSLDQGTQRGKWAPPGQGESDCKVINSKPYAFNPQTNQWDVVLTAQNSTNKQAEVAGQLDNAMIADTELIGNALRGL